MARTVILPTLAYSSSNCWWYFLANLMNSRLPTSSPNLGRFWLTRGLILTLGLALAASSKTSTSWVSTQCFGVMQLLSTWCITDIAHFCILFTYGLSSTGTESGARSIILSQCYPKMQGGARRQCWTAVSKQFFQTILMLMTHRLSHTVIKPSRQWPSSGSSRPIRCTIISFVS